MRVQLPDSDSIVLRGAWRRCCRSTRRIVLVKVIKGNPAKQGSTPRNAWIGACRSERLGQKAFLGSSNDPIVRNRI